MMLTAPVSAQLSVLPIDTLNDKISYIGVVKVDSASAKELYTRCKFWFSQTYNSSKDVLQNLDNDNFSIVGKAVMIPHVQNFGYRTWGTIKYTIVVFCKDNRYKYQISDFYHEGDALATATTYTPTIGFLTDYTKNKKASGYFRQKEFDKLCVELNEYVNKLIASLESGMSKKLESKTEDW